MPTTRASQLIAQLCESPADYYASTGFGSKQPYSTESAQIITQDAGGYLVRLYTKWSGLPSVTRAAGPELAALIEREFSSVRALKYYSLRDILDPAIKAMIQKLTDEENAKLTGIKIKKLVPRRKMLDGQVYTVTDFTVFIAAIDGLKFYKSTPKYLVAAYYSKEPGEAVSEWTVKGPPHSYGYKFIVVGTPGQLAKAYRECNRSVG